MPIFQIQNEVVLSDMVTETVSVLCRKSITFSNELHIKGILTIKIDRERVMLLEVDKTILEASFRESAPPKQECTDRQYCNDFIVSSSGQQDNFDFHSSPMMMDISTAKSEGDFVDSVIVPESSDCITQNSYDSVESRIAKILTSARQQIEESPAPMTKSRPIRHYNWKEEMEVQSKINRILASAQEEITEMQENSDHYWNKSSAQSSDEVEIDIKPVIKQEPIQNESSEPWQLFNSEQGSTGCSTNEAILINDDDKFNEIVIQPTNDMLPLETNEEGLGDKLENECNPNEAKNEWVLSSGYLDRSNTVNWTNKIQEILDSFTWFPNSDMQYERMIEEVSSKLTLSMNEGTDGEMLWCAICQENLRSNYHLRRHLRTHIKARLPSPSKYKKNSLENCDQPSINIFKCVTCACAFRCESDLNDHDCVLMKENKCPHCPKKFLLKNALNSHIMMHSKKRSRKDKPFKCKTCGKGFAQSSHLNVHKLIHTGERPHKCNVCGRGFTVSSNLRKHLLSHSGEKLY